MMMNMGGPSTVSCRSICAGRKAGQELHKGAEAEGGSIGRRVERAELEASASAGGQRRLPDGLALLCRAPS